MRLLSLLILITFASCYSERIIISVLEPAASSLPPEIRRVSVFPLPGYTPVKNQIDSLKTIKLSEKADAQQIKVGYLDGIYDVMANSPRFERVVLSDSSYGRFLENGFLYWDELRTICKHDSTDHVLLLQKAIMYDHLIKATYDASTYYGVFKIMNETKWAFIQPFEEKFSTGFSYVDSLHLEGIFGTEDDTGYSSSYSEGDAPYLLYRACYTSGYLTGTKICPHWKDTVRTYFDGPGLDMRHASRLVKRNNWPGAGFIWNGLIDGPNRSLASKAAYNIALAWEHDDDLEQALSWLEYADSLGNNKKISAYKKILENRLIKQKILDRQLPLIDHDL